MKKVFVMVGIPGSGKSTWVEQNKLPNSAVLNADSIREQLYGDANIQGNGKEVFGLLYDKFVEALKNPEVKAIYLDNTSVDSRARNTAYDFIEASGVQCDVTLVVFKNFDQAYERNQNRDRVVPNHVLDNMKDRLNAPTPEEADKYNVIVIDKN